MRCGGRLAGGLQSDKEIEVRTKPGTVIVFGADGDFGLQIAKLDYQWEMLAKAPMPASKINLSLGREVPVTFEVRRRKQHLRSRRRFPHRRSPPHFFPSSRIRSPRPNRELQHHFHRRR